MAYPNIYNQSLALLTDQYQVTMAYGYWKQGLADREAVFHLFFRKKPFGGGFAIASGLEGMVAYLEKFRFDPTDLAYLETITDIEDKRMFPAPFLDYLEAMRFSCTIDAVPEGTAVFPYEPLVRVRGPILQCQLLETPLLNLINFPTIIATKAARISVAAGDDEVIEFGLRRAQGIDGALTAARAAFVGGCTSTSNVLAGKLFGIPIRGTHSHSWVMIFDTELESFQAYAEALPNNCVFLVDTYNTICGVKNAIKAGLSLRERGYPMLGIRLDSGDLAYLSIEARRLLDEAGFHETKIVASNELDEVLIADLKRQGSTITVWGVGTNLVTAKGQPALDGVYKISAIRDEHGKWKYKLKLSEQLSKVSNPGILQARRYSRNGESIGDVIYDIRADLSGGCTMVDPFDPTKIKAFSKDVQWRDLLVSVFEEGKLVYKLPSLVAIQANTKKELSSFHSGIKRFFNPHIYPVGMENSLFALKTELIKKVRVEETN